MMLARFNLLTPAELEVCEYLIRGVQTKAFAERRSTALVTTRDQIKAASANSSCNPRLDRVRLALGTQPPPKNP